MTIKLKDMELEISDDCIVEISDNKISINTPRSLKPIFPEEYYPYIPPPYIPPYIHYTDKTYYKPIITCDST